MKNNNRTNPVAKFGNRLHRPATHRDKTKYYRKGQTAQFWNSETKDYETWHIGDCEFCGKSVDKDTGECKEYKCWI